MNKSWRKIYKICIKIYLNSPISFSSIMSFVRLNWIWLKKSWERERERCGATKIGDNNNEKWEETCSHLLILNASPSLHNWKYYCHRIPCMCINKRHHINLYLEAARHVILMLIAILNYTQIDCDRKWNINSRKCARGRLCENALPKFSNKVKTCR